MDLCLICKSSVNNDQEKILLLNGDYIHSGCLTKLKGIIFTNQTELINKKRELASLGKNNITGVGAGIGGIVGTFLGGPVGTFIGAGLGGLIGGSLSESREKIEVKQKILNEIILELDNNIEGSKKLLTSIYDFWSDYPPDWDERRDSILEEIGICEICGYQGGSFSTSKYGRTYFRRNKKRPFQIHHKVSIRKGGNHLRGNLILLCKKCHQSKHRHDISSDRKFTNYQSDNPFLKKLSLIQDAIQQNKKIKLRYVNKEGIQTYRTVKPNEIIMYENTQCVAGSCHLRNAERTFAIRRILELEII